MHAPDLTLYHYEGCGFCGRVRAAMRELGLTMELRNILEDPGAEDELRQARGRATVPVLHIAAAEGEQRWMPESADIVRYLYQRFGEGRRPSPWIFITPQHVMLGLAALGLLAWVLLGG